MKAKNFLPVALLMMFITSCGVSSDFSNRKYLRLKPLKLSGIADFPYIQLNAQSVVTVSEQSQPQDSISTPLILDTMLTVCAETREEPATKPQPDQFISTEVTDEVIESELAYVENHDSNQVSVQRTETLTSSEKNKETQKVDNGLNVFAIVLLSVLSAVALWAAIRIIGFNAEVIEIISW